LENFQTPKNKKPTIRDDCVGLSYKSYFHNRAIALQLGFTLHEAVIALGIISGLSLMAVSMQDLLRRNHLITQANLLISHLNFTRSEAIKRGETVTLCKSNTGTNCTRSSEWHEGWIIFADKNGNHLVDADEAIIRIQQPLANGYTLKFGALTPNYVTYKPDGFGGSNGTFTFCHKQRTIKPKTVVLYWTGRARISDKSDFNDCG
jgi:type IV fimbrial biogenesis protein FimT